MKYFILALVIIFGAAAYLLAQIPRDISVEIPDTIVIVRDRDTNAPDYAEYKDLLRVTTPTAGATVTSPVTLTGEARGPWYFEATFPVAIVDWNGQIIGEGYVEATDEWMTEEFVPFSGEVTFDVALVQGQYSASGTIIFQKSNASGLPEHDDAFEIPVVFELAPQS